MRTVVLLSIATGCLGAEPTNHHRPSATHAADLTTALRAQGYDVDVGALKFFRIEDCAQLPTCYGNNPRSPYGLYMLPAAPGEAPLPADLPALFTDGDLRAGWRLREDEALVFVGELPEAAYYSFRSYLFQRDGKDLFASLGDSTSSLVLEPAAGRTAAVITTADAALDSVLRSALVASGLPRTAIATDHIRVNQLRMGHGADADLLTMLFRVADVDDAAALEPYFDRPPATVLRIRPRTPRTVEPFTVVDRPRGTGTTEDHLRGSLLALDRAIRARDPLLDREPTLLGAPLPLDGARCIELGVQCLGDNRDTLYYVTGTGLLSADPGDYFLIWGVNHTVAGKATYTSIAAYERARQLGVGGLADAELAGSATAYLPDDPNANALYVAKFARRCSAGERACFEVPTTFPGVALDEPVLFIMRPYLEPSTATGPLADELLPPRVMHVTP